MRKRYSLHYFVLAQLFSYWYIRLWHAVRFGVVYELTNIHPETYFLFIIWHLLTKYLLAHLLSLAKCFMTTNLHEHRIRRAKFFVEISTSEKENEAVFFWKSLMEQIVLSVNYNVKLFFTSKLWPFLFLYNVVLCIHSFCKMYNFLFWIWNAHSEYRRTQFDQKNEREEREREITREKERERKRKEEIKRDREKLDIFIM